MLKNWSEVATKKVWVQAEASREIVNVSSFACVLHHASSPLKAHSTAAH